MTPAAAKPEPPRAGGGEPAPAASLASVPIRGGRQAEARKAGRIERTPAALRPAPPGDGPPPRRRGSAELVTYWARLRGGRRLPSPADLDPALIAAAWPEALLLRFDAPDGGRPADAVPRITRFDEGRGGTPATVPPAAIEWAMGLARRALRSGDIIRETARFAGPAGPLTEALLLPLSLRREADHVLCHLRLC